GQTGFTQAKVGCYLSHGRSMNVELIVLSISRDAEDNRLHAFLAVQSVGGAGFDVNGRTRFDVDDVFVQFHLATPLQDVVHLGALTVIVLDGVLDERHVKVTDRGFWKSERPGALAAFAADGRGLLESADQVAF